MTETMGSSPGGTPTTGGAGSTRDVAKQETQGVAQDAVQSGKATAETAKQQAGEVAGEVSNQARQLFDQAREQITSQGGEQKTRATEGLRSLADELSGLVHGEGTSNGMVTDLAREASQRVRTTADWLETHEPSDVLNEARRFAQRRPGAFLLGAAALGLIGGRLTRGFADEVKEYAEAEERGSTAPTFAAPLSSGTGSGMGTTDPFATGVSHADPVHEATTRTGELPTQPPGTPGYSVPPTERGTDGLSAEGDLSGRGQL